MSLPRVSVIVCTYNNGATLARSLESLAAQDYPNFHIVVVDDCSSDNSVAVAKSFEARFPGLIRSITNPRNLGLVGNYAGASRYFEGEYFMLGGPDDSWSPEFLSEMVGALEHVPQATLAMSSVRSQYDDGESDIHRYGMLSSQSARGGTAMAIAIVNGVDQAGNWSAPFNSFIHGVGRSRLFSATIPDDPVFWYIELQLIVMFALMGGLVKVDRPLYVRHRFRQSWEERYPQDSHVATGLRFWPRLHSAARFARHAMRRKELGGREKLAIPRIFFAIVAFQVLRPAWAPRLRKWLPRSAVTALRSFVYKFTH